MDEIPDLRPAASRGRVLVVVGLLCVAALVACGALVWNWIRPTVDAVASVKASVPPVFETDSDTKLLRYQSETTSAYSVLAITWEPRRPLTPAEVQTANDRLWRRLRPLLEERWSSVVLVPVRETERTVGAGTMRTTIGLGRHVYGRPIDDDTIDSVLDD